jgi:histidyl-tRNA synthetase
MANTKPARGMRDFLPSDVRKRNYVIGIIKEVYESYGFEPLETPAVENIETLTGKYGEEGNQLIFKILKRGEKLDVNADEKDLSDLALRYDLTVPLARVVANHKNDLPKFFKRYQIQPVWRADRPARGRYREFYQCDVDAIGSNSMIVEAELISAVCEILERLEFKDYVIKVNHREFLFSMLEYLGISQELHNDALVTIDKLDKLPKIEVGNELLEKGISQDSVKRLMDHYDLAANAFNGADANRVMISMVMRGSYESQKDLIEMVELTNNPHVRLYPYLARGLSYYTGSIFEIVLLVSNEYPEFKGSLGGGGRYDGLIGMFGKEQIPAVGFSLGLERILLIMEERGMFPKELSESSADVLVTVWNEESIGESLKLAAELRKQNLRVLVYPEADKLGKQFKYADSIKIPFVCVLGESELAENKVTLKNLLTGEQETIERVEVSKKIRQQ